MSFFFFQLERISAEELIQVGVLCLGPRGFAHLQSRQVFVYFYKNADGTVQMVETTAQCCMYSLHSLSVCVSYSMLSRCARKRSGQRDILCEERMFTNRGCSRDSNHGQFCTAATVVARELVGSAVSPPSNTDLTRWTSRQT